MKAEAKAHTVKVVIKSVGEAAASDLEYGTKAMAAVGNAALHDAATFMPVLSGLAPQFLPQLASNLVGQGPAGLANVLGNLASAIGGALVGNSAIGVAGPPLLASRVANLLPDNLLQSLAGVVTPAGGLSPAAGGLDQLIQNMPPQALDMIVNFLAGEWRAWQARAVKGREGGERKGDGARRGVSRRNGLWQLQVPCITTLT